jgi:hypothetical protein
MTRESRENRIEKEEIWWQRQTKKEWEKNLDEQGLSMAAKKGDPTVQFRSQQHTKKNQSCKGEKKSRIIKTISLNSELHYMGGISLYISEFKFASQIQLDQRE